MKIFCIYFDEENRMTARLGADSAVLRPGEPVFAADDQDQWHTALVPAVRISRVGMAIGRKQAHGYRDSITLFHMMTPVHEEAWPVPVLALDRTFSPGNWLKLDADNAHVYNVRARRSMLASQDSTDFPECNFSLDSLQVDRVIHELSQNITFKMGDLLLFPQSGIPLGHPVLDSAVEAEMDSSPVIKIKIK